MAVYRTISMSFWTDSKVVDEFTPEDRYFYLFLFTNPHTNLSGCYEISTKQMASETGYDVQTIMALIKRFETVHNVIRYSAETKEMLLLNWHKYNWTASEKFRKPLLKEIESIKSPAFKDYLQQLADGKEVRYGIDTNCSDITVTVTVTDTDTVSDIDLERDIGGVGGKEETKTTPSEIINLYNETCTSLPTATKLTNARESAIRLRLKTYSLEDFKRLFEMAEASDFLSGRSGKWMGANIDWLIKESNMQKVLEGNYANKGSAGHASGNAYIDAINNRLKVVEDWVNDT